MMRSALIVVALAVSGCFRTFRCRPVDSVRVEKDVDYVAGADYRRRQGPSRPLPCPRAAPTFPPSFSSHGGGLRNGDKHEWEHIGQAFAAEGVGMAIAKLSSVSDGDAPRACRRRGAVDRAG